MQHARTVSAEGFSPLSGTEAQDHTLLVVGVDLAPGVDPHLRGTLEIEFYPESGEAPSQRIIPVNGAFDWLDVGAAVKGSAAEPRTYAINAVFRDTDGNIALMAPDAIQITAASGQVTAGLLLAPIP